MGMLFLFDHLIPVYRIREQHYAIGKVYRWATPAETKTGSAKAPGEPPYSMVYLKHKFDVWPAGDDALRQVEKWLVVLRMIGVVLTVFLFAAINALTH